MLQQALQVTAKEHYDDDIHRTLSRTQTLPGYAEMVECRHHKWKLQGFQSLQNCLPDLRSNHLQDK